MRLVTIDLDELKQKINIAVSDEEYCKKNKDYNGAALCNGKFHAFMDVKEMILNTPQQTK